MKEYNMTVVFVLSLIFSFSSCGNNSEKNSTRPEIANAEPVEVPEQDGMKKAYFASGCFWCVEAIYESVRGVEEVVSGYAGGHTSNPTYEETNTGTTGHAETVEVIYDPEVIDFATLVDVYFASQDPTQENGQGPDIGSQYRSIIFYQNEEQKEIIEEKKAELAQQYEEDIAAEVLPFQKFWPAEAYHQDYEANNPQNPYIRNVSIPRIQRFERRMPELLKETDHE